MPVSSPMGQGLLARKMERQMDAEQKSARGEGRPLPEGLQRPKPSNLQIPGTPTDDLKAPAALQSGLQSPAYEKIGQIQQLQLGDDPLKDSSPLGAALLARKAQRQQEEGVTPRPPSELGQMQPPPAPAR